MRPRAWLDENRKRTGVFGTALRVPLMLAVFANLLSSCAWCWSTNGSWRSTGSTTLSFSRAARWPSPPRACGSTTRCGVFAYKACERRTVVRVAGASLPGHAFMNLPSAELGSAAWALWSRRIDGVAVGYTYDQS